MNFGAAISEHPLTTQAAGEVVGAVCTHELAVPDDTAAAGLQLAPEEAGAVSPFTGAPNTTLLLGSRKRTVSGTPGARSFTT